MEQNKDQSCAAVRGEAVAKALDGLTLYEPSEAEIGEMESGRGDWLKYSDVVALLARAADAPSEPSDLLYAAVMNIPCERTMSHFVTLAELRAYKEGHHAARHAAVNLVAAFKSRAADALDSQPGTDEPTDREALIACLGDDAATLSHLNPDDEMAQTMREAIAMLESDEVVIATLGMASSQPTDGGVRNG